MELTAIGWDCTLDGIVTKVSIYITGVSARHHVSLEGEVVRV